VIDSITRQHFQALSRAADAVSASSLSVEPATAARDVPVSTAEDPSKGGQQNDFDHVTTTAAPSGAIIDQIIITVAPMLVC